MAGIEPIAIEVDAKPFLDEARKRYADPTTSGVTLSGCPCAGDRVTRGAVTDDGGACECGRPFARWAGEPWGSDLLTLDPPGVEAERLRRELDEARAALRDLRNVASYCERVAADEFDLDMRQLTAAIEDASAALGDRAEDVTIGMAKASEARIAERAAARQGAALADARAPGVRS